MKKEEKFYDHLIGKGYSSVTIKGYKKVLTKFLKESKPTKKRAEKYLIEMRKKDYSYSHIRNTTTIIRKFMKFIGKPIDIDNPRKPNTLPVKEILTEGEIARIMAACKNSREKALLGILAYCGVRNKELRGVKIGHLDIKNNNIKIIGGKFRKDRIVPINEELFQILMNYLKDCPREKGYLFTTLREGKQYTGWALRQRVKVVASRAKIKKRVYPHKFRHSMITHLLERGANVIAVKQLAGHANLNTTMRYTHFSPKRIYQEYQYFIPSYA